MKTKNHVIKQFLLIILLASPAAFAGADGAISGGGDPPIFVMPKEDFSYFCTFTLRGQHEGDSYYLAKKGVELPKKAFKSNGESYVSNGEKYEIPASMDIAEYTSKQENGWSVEIFNSPQNTDQLPEFLIGQKLRLLLRGNGTISLVLEGKLSNQHIIETVSRSIPFQSTETLDADVTYKDAQFSVQNSLTLSAKCRKTN